jgi:valyl-tRNA synthetase
MECFQIDKRMEVSETPQPESSKVAIEWYEAKLQQTLLEIEGNFEKYRISEALMGTYKLVWDGSWFLEMIKPAYQQPDSITFESNRNACNLSIASIYAVLDRGNLADSSRA